jgi:acyl carrier protein
LQSQNEIESQILQIFTSILNGLTQSEIMELEYGKSQLWDSLAFMEIFIAVESHFEVVIPDYEILNLKSVYDFVNIVNVQLKSTT